MTSCRSSTCGPTRRPASSPCSTCMPRSPEFKDNPITSRQRSTYTSVITSVSEGLGAVRSTRRRRVTCTRPARSKEQKEPIEVDTATDTCGTENAAKLTEYQALIIDVHCLMRHARGGRGNSRPQGGSGGKALGAPRWRLANLGTLTFGQFSRQCRYSTRCARLERAIGSATRAAYLDLTSFAVTS